MIKRAVVAAALLSVGAGAVYPCGGPEYFRIDAPLVDPDRMLDGLFGLDGYWGPFRPPEATFLYPLVAAHLGPREARWLSDLGAVGEIGLNEPPRPTDSTQVVTLDGFRRAVDVGDRATIQRAARAIVDRVLDFPAPLADANQAAFRRAVEYLELAPVLDRQPIEIVRAFTAESARGSTDWPSPLREALRIRTMTRSELAAYADSAPTSLRAPSLRYVALQEEMKREIPNGWLSDVQKAAAPALWSRLQASHQRWLADFPSSPLLDLVRLSQLRIHHFSGDQTEGTKLLLDFYPDRHPARVLYEMRLFGLDSLAAEHSRADPALRTALGRAATGAEWCQRWRTTEASPDRKWALAQQEQLLYRMDRDLSRPDSTLPECFPAKAENPTEFWGKARLAVLLGRGRDAEAKAQLALLEQGSEVAPIAARFAIQEGRWVDAALTPGLDSAAVLYLIRVLAPRPAVDTMSRSTIPWIREEAALTLAIPQSEASDWKSGAAILAKAGSPRAETWRRAAALAKDTSRAGRLAFARFLVKSEGRIFYPHDRIWYRSVAGRLLWIEASLADPKGPGAIPPSPAGPLDQEAARIRGHLLTTSEGYLALKTYRSVLEEADRNTPGLPGIVKEADRVYRKLIDWSNATTSFWADRLVTSPEAVAIRRAGRLTRPAKRS